MDFTQYEANQTLINERHRSCSIKLHYSVCKFYAPNGGDLVSLFGIFDALKQLILLQLNCANMIERTSLYIFVPGCYILHAFL